MTHLYLIRHADYTYALDGDRKRDLGLSADGKAQAERLRDRLVKSGELKPDVYMCSPERGARETAEMLRPALGEPTLFDPDIEEWRSEDGTMDTDEFMGLWKQTPRVLKPFLRFIPVTRRLSNLWPVPNPPLVELSTNTRAKISS